MYLLGFLPGSLHARDGSSSSGGILAHCKNGRSRAESDDEQNPR